MRIIGVPQGRLIGFPEAQENFDNRPAVDENRRCLGPILAPPQGGLARGGGNWSVFLGEKSHHEVR